MHQLWIRSLALALVLLLTVAACTSMGGQPEGDGLANSIAPRLADEAMIVADGSALPVRRWMPEGNPQAAVVALHGFNDYSNAFAEPGLYLAQRGVAVYAYDQRGFGDAPHRGRWPGSAVLAADLGTMVDLVRARHPGIPVYVLGESMGGAVAMVAMTGPNPPRIDGAILSAPAIWGRSTMPWYQRGAVWLSGNAMPWLTLTGRGLKIMPSDNIAMLRALGHDPKIIKATRTDTIMGLCDLMDQALDAAPRLDERILMLYGMRDEVVPREPTWKMIRALPAEARDRQRVALYTHGYHMLLRDLEAHVVLADIAAWIRDSTAPLPSRADEGMFQAVAQR